LAGLIGLNKSGRELPIVTSGKTTAGPSGIQSILAPSVLEAEEQNPKTPQSTVGVKLPKKEDVVMKEEDTSCHD
jgi:hypothetical protein